MLVLLIISTLVSTALGGNLCLSDDDCSALGELKCIKTSCKWGTCGCYHGTVSRYLGSFQNYKCVPLRNIGESCSTEDDTGICGPSQSLCNQTTNVCDCRPGYYVSRGGEACVTSPGIGESELSSVGSCSNNNYYSAMNRMYPETCRCPQRSRIDYTRDSISFYTRITPACVQNGVGDLCLTDDDCDNSMECVDDQCQCRSPLIPNYESTQCRRALPIDAKCMPPDSSHVGADLTPSDYHCDGRLGLVCGDKCKVEEEPANYTCQCGPYHRRSGNLCNQIGENGECYGDYNCRGWKPTAVCENSRCVDGGSVTWTPTVLSLMVPVMTSYITSQRT